MKCANWPNIADQLILQVYIKVFILLILSILIFGPFSLFSVDGLRCFSPFVDDFSRHTCLYLMKSREEVPHIVRNFHQMILTQFRKKSKYFI